MRLTIGNPGRPVLAGLAAVALASVGGFAAGAAPPGPAQLTCTNPASGAHWKISIDFARSTVDANPARISEATISWRDRTDLGNYTLDRKTGDLTVVVASSTGGYFLHDHCRAD
jgi:hypothetical protein